MTSASGPRPWLAIDSAHRPEVERYRRELLDRIFPPFVILGSAALGLGSWRAMRDGQWGFAAAYLVLYAGCVVAVVASKRATIRTRASLLLVSLFALGVVGLLRLGLSGVGVLLFVVGCGLTAILRGARASLWAVAISMAVMGAVGFGMVQGYIEMPPEQLQTSLSAGSWVASAATFGAITAGLVIPFQTIAAKLAESLSSVEQRTRDFERSNEQLREEVERRQQAEEALRSSERRYRGIFETASVAIWEEDLSHVRTAIAELQADGVEDIRSYLDDHPEHVARAAQMVRVRDVNNATVELYGASSKEELLESIDRVFVPESFETFREVLVALAEGRPRFEGESINQTLLGERIHVLIRAAIPEDEHENVLVSVMDVTERKTLEQSLAEAQKMEAIGTLAGGIAHDFNNLLMGIQGFVSIMLRHVSTQDPHHRYLTSIEQMVDSGAALTGQLLGFARGGKYVVETTDLKELLDRSIAIFGRAKKEIRTHQRLAPDLKPVDVDRSQIEQVLLNLYVNAWQAMPDGGDLYVAARNVTLDAETAGRQGRQAGHYVCITVTDTGVGMDQRTCARVFEPFFTTKQPARGTGLGLASAYGIVNNHGGWIEVDSVQGEGATFTIHLPAVDKPLPSRELPVTDTPPGYETVLLIDDERAVRNATTAMLQELGYRVQVAANGKQALERFEAGRDDLGLVILDMVMPDVTGTELFDRLQAISRDVPVLLSSGYSHDEKTEALLKRGAAGFVQKPFGLSELSRKVREVLDEP